MALCGASWYRHLAAIGGGISYIPFSQDRQKELGAERYDLSFPNNFRFFSTIPSSKRNKRAF